VVPGNVSTASTDPYATLEVSPDASDGDLKRAYRRMAMRWHPDRNPDDPEAAEQFKAIANAWALLSDPTKRAAFDTQAGRIARGSLPEAFLEDVEHAIVRAQDWIERTVLPHYASRYWRGAGAELRAILVRDLEYLGTVPALPAQDTFWGKRRAAKWVAELTVSMDPRPTTTLSYLLPGHRGRPRAAQILIAPYALWTAGFREATEIDDAILRVLIARYVQLLASRAIRPPADPEDWPAVIAAARQVDDAAGIARTRRGLARLALCLLLLTMLISGYFGI
jgi:hypothetical protein